MLKKWQILTEICFTCSIKIWVSWQWYVAFPSAWLEGSELFPKAIGRDIWSVIWTIWTSKLKETQVLAPAESIPPKWLLLSSFPACVYLPHCSSRTITSWSHPRSYWLGSCCTSGRRHEHTEPEMYTLYLLTSTGSLHLSSSSSSRQNWPPILPTQSPWSVWEQRRRLETGILLGELKEPGRQAPQLECVARGPGREKAWGHCDPLSQTPWGTLSSERPPLAHEAERHRELTRGKVLKVINPR